MLLPDSKWIDAVKLPLRVTIGVFVAAIALLLLDQFGYLRLIELGSAAKITVTTVAVLFGALAMTGSMGIALDHMGARRKRSIFAERHAVRVEEQRAKRIEYEAAVLARIEYLSEGEIRHLAEALRKQSQSFYTWVHSPAVTTLIEKGLVKTLGGTHHEDHFPFTIIDFVWRHLLDRKIEIIAKDDAYKKAAEDKKRRGR